MQNSEEHRFAIAWRANYNGKPVMLFYAGTKYERVAELHILRTAYISEAILFDRREDAKSRIKDTIGEDSSLTIIRVSKEEYEEGQRLFFKDKLAGHTVWFAKQDK